MAVICQPVNLRVGDIFTHCSCLRTFKHRPHRCRRVHHQCALWCLIVNSVRARAFIRCCYKQPHFVDGIGRHGKIDILTRKFRGRHPVSISPRRVGPRHTHRRSVAVFPCCGFSACSCCGLNRQTDAHKPDCDHAARPDPAASADPSVNSIAKTDARPDAEIYQRAGRNNVLSAGLPVPPAFSTSASSNVQ